jgi:hypothetical protein
MTTLDPTKNFDGPFRFTDLPPELRDMVYHEVWSASSDIFTFRLVGANNTYSRALLSSSTLLPQV